MVRVEGRVRASSHKSSGADETEPTHAPPFTVVHVRMISDSSLARQ